MRGEFLYNIRMKNYVKQPWSHEERTLLTNSWYIRDKESLQKLFPNRTYNACVKQAKYLRDRGWRFKKPSL
tara:strand:- start:2074 stop:2286 length:213 start_codon:yes stop_codon:yes gene_type:complete